MIIRDRNLPIDPTLVNDCIREFDLDVTRRTELYNEFLGSAEIALRTRTTGLPNNKLAHAFPQYIVTITSGYLIGDPVQYVDEKQTTALQDVLEAYDGADVQSVDSEVALNQAIFGRGVELSYANRDANPRVVALDPRDSFVVYDDTADRYPLFGVYRLRQLTPAGSIVVQKIQVYTETEIIEYEGDTGKEVSRVPHPFGIVPIVEYWNNAVERGDFESVGDLIDAYDLLQSDRINDKEQFADALLVLSGVLGLANSDDADDTRTAAQRLREERTLSLPEGASAQYLVKTMAEADVDVLRKAIQADIHKFSMVPDLSDENFVGNSSGVAMKYKLFGLEQLTKIKERWFREGLRWRLRLFSNFLAVKGSQKLDADKVQMVFKRSLPVNEVEIAGVIQTLQGIVPDHILLSQVPFIEDVDAAIEALDKQKAEGIAAQAAAFGSMPIVEEQEAE